MPISFPLSPTIGQTYTSGSSTWEWDGEAWNILQTAFPFETSPRIATSSLTGVASFGYGLDVSALGAVSLTSSYVTSFNGSTGPIGYSPRLGTSSLTGVASFGYGLDVSALGAVSLTSSYVTSFNGTTGPIGYSPRLATTSLTGVASFNSTYFGVDAVGAVSLVAAYQATGDTVVAGGRISTSRSGNTVTVSNAVPIATSSVTGVASFGYGLDVSALGAVSLTSSYVSSFNGTTGPIAYSPRLSTSSLTGVASFGYGLDVSALGAVSLTSSYVSSFNGVTGPIGYSPRLATSSLTGVASFGYGLDVSALGAVSITSSYVTSFNGTTGPIGYSPRLATSSLTGVASFGYGFDVSALGAVSLTSSYVSSFNGVTGPIGYSPRLATTSLTGVASFGYGFDVSALGAVSLTSSYVSSVNGFTGPITIAQGTNVTISSVAGTVTINSSGGGGGSSPLATSSLTGVASFHSTDFSVATTGHVSLGATVAKTDVANTFTPKQTFFAGLTSQSIYVSRGATFGSTVNILGNVGMSGNVSVDGNSTLGNAVSDHVIFPSGQRVYTDSLETTSVSQVTIAAQPIYQYSCADVLVQAERHDGAGGTIGVQSVRYMVVATPVTDSVVFNQYANVGIASPVGTFTVDVGDIGGFNNWRVRVTPASTDPTRFRVFATIFPTVGGIGV